MFLLCMPVWCGDISETIEVDALVLGIRENNKYFFTENLYARVAELVDALVLGTSGAIHGGSSPLAGTKKRKQAKACFLFLYPREY